MNKRETVAAEDSETTRNNVRHGRALWIYFAAAALALGGLADAIYLTVKHLTGESLRCTISGGCNEVLGSAYASIGGIPLATFGAVAYFMVFSLSTLAAFGYNRAAKLLSPLVMLMLVVTLWLLYVQAFVLHKFCEYCLLSAAVTFSLAAIVMARRFAERKAEST